MKFHRAILAVLISASFGFGQSGELPNATVPNATVPNATVPNAAQVKEQPRAASWTLIVEKSGGFTGFYRQISSLTSDAPPVLAAEDKAAPAQGISAAELKSLSEKIWAVKSSGQPLDDPDFCLDCVITTLRIFRTDENGVTDIITCSWNPATYGAVPADIKNVYENISKDKK